jgi:hypothetical protein
MPPCSMFVTFDLEADNKGMRSESTIETRHPERKRGISIPEQLYNELVGFVMQQIAANESVTLAKLLRYGELHFDNHFNINNLIYHVKLDLEVRGYIKMVLPAYESVTHIKLTSKGKGILKSAVK